MDITGKIVQKNEERQITDSFKVKEFVADCGNFNQVQEWQENILKFQVKNSKIEELNKIPDGSIVKISFFPNGRWFDKKDNSGKDVAFNLDAFRFEVLKEAAIDSSDRTTTNEIV